MARLYSSELHTRSCSEVKHKALLKAGLLALADIFAFPVKPVAEIKYRWCNYSCGGSHSFILYRL